MDDYILKWMHDIRLALDEIDSYFKLRDKKLFEYKRK